MSVHQPYLLVAMYGSNVGGRMQGKKGSWKKQKCNCVLCALGQPHLRILWLLRSMAGVWGTVGMRGRGGVGCDWVISRFQAHNIFLGL